MICRIHTKKAARLVPPACVLAFVTAISPKPPSPLPVFVTASFTDSRGFFIENLERDEVQVLENGEPRQIEVFARAEMPAVYGLLFDRAVMPEASDSGRRSSFEGVDAATTLKEIAYGLIDKELGRKLLWVGAYEQELQVLRPASSDESTAKSAVQLLTGRRNAEEGFLYSGVVSAVGLMNKRPEHRRVIVLFVGVADRKSTGKNNVLKNLLASSNLELFVVSSASRFQSPGSIPYNLSEAFLRELAGSTSGEAFFLRPGEPHLDDTIRRILGQTRSFYTLGFESTGTVERPATLLVKCSRPGSKVRHHPVSPVLE